MQKPRLNCNTIDRNNLSIGSGGWIRTSDQLINSQLRYRCATPERETHECAYYTKTAVPCASGNFPSAAARVDIRS